MSVFSFLKEIFKPAVELIDELHTSEEEKLSHKAKTLNTYADALEAGYEYEQRNLNARAEIVKAESESEHWLTSTWRPITMLSLLSLVMLDSFGVLPNELSPQAWVLLQLGVGGYVVGRSAEKVAKVVSDLKQKDKT